MDKRDQTYLKTREGRRVVTAIIAMALSRGTLLSTDKSMLAKHSAHQRGTGHISYWMDCILYRSTAARANAQLKNFLDDASVVELEETTPAWTNSKLEPDWHKTTHA